MPSPWIFIPAAGAVASASAGLDAYFGGHGADWLIALCLTDPAATMQMPTLPMRHGSVLPFAAATCGFASLGCLGAWLAQRPSEADTAPPPDRDFAVMAALAMLFNTSTKPRPHDLALAVIQVTGRAPALQPDVALDMFTPDAMADDLNLFACMTNRADRALVMGGALAFARARPPSLAIGAILIRLAIAMRMGPLEFFRYGRALVRNRENEFSTPQPMAHTGLFTKPLPDPETVDA